MLKIYYSLLKSNKKLTTLTIAQTINRFGDTLDTIALSWLMLKLTNSGFMMGLVLICNIIPNFIFSFWAGVIVDRKNRFKLMVFCDFFRGIMALIIPLLMITHFIQYWHLFIITFIISTFEIFSTTALDSSISLIVDNDHLMSANSVMSMSKYLINIIGYMGAAYIVSFLGLELSFSINSFTFFACSFLIYFIKIKQTREVSSLSIKNMLIEIKEGLSYVIKNKIILSINIICIITNMSLGAPIVILMPILVKRHYQLESWAYSLIAASFALGSFIGSMAVGSFFKNRSKGKILFLGILLSGLSFSILGFLPDYYISLSLFFLIGAGFSASAIPMYTIIQLNVKDDYLGKVFASNRVVVLSAVPLSYAISGFLIETISLNIIIFLLGGIILSTYLLRFIIKDLYES